MITTVSLEMLDPLAVLLLDEESDFELELELDLEADLLLEDESLELAELDFPLDPPPPPAVFRPCDDAPAFLLAATTLPFFSADALTLLPSELTVTVPFT